MMTTVREVGPGNTKRTVAIGVGAGVTAGLLINLFRKAAVQAPTVLAGQWDKALAAEHAASEQACNHGDEQGRLEAGLTRPQRSFGSAAEGATSCEYT